jgi:carbon monoxide dehydrogenase subunit G
MKISAAARVAAPRERVFEALNDPVVLRHCIPGCEELTEDETGAYQVRLKLGIAGLKGQYVGTATPENLEPPRSFTLAFDGKGKTGFVRGSAAIEIVDDEGTARIECEADVQAGGAIAAVGSRLMVAVARKLTRDFFRQLATEIGAAPEAPGDAEEDLDQR